MTADLLREKFLDFFRVKKHRIVESDSLVPTDDPTVLFTSAGMNQFKKEFLGLDSGFKRAATCQRCLRTDDLDRVGKTPGHHTFFEMLGNFSFGDYFKKEAIGLAWEFLTEGLKIKKEKLWVSLYKDDTEAYKLWRDLIKIPSQRVIKLGDKENFWPQEAKKKGPNGPCGPCSEIFYDQGSNIGCKRTLCEPSCKCGRFVEVWNLVFTQFNRKERGILEPLPKKNIDTGMGLERLAAVMQGVQNNFETDLFKPLINEIIYEVKFDNPESKELIYAIADHTRAIAFAIYDGVLPSNEARGYVVRKLIRKSLLHLKNLGIGGAFLYKLIPILSQVMKKPYPELNARRENIASIILSEEKNFITTLDSNEALFKEKFSGQFKKPDPTKVGKIAFQLYDTYGMPLELTRIWLEKHSLKISENAFNQELEEQKNRSKSMTTMKGDIFKKQGIYSNLKETKFLGYKVNTVKTRIARIIKDNHETKLIKKSHTATVILDKTVFYPESGGQIGDTGEFAKGKNIFEVLDTERIGKVIMHIGRVKEGSFKISDFITGKINSERRLNIARNHTATHLLQSALRKVLGVHVRQQGSLVAEDRLRFDFTHFKDITKAELDRIEEIVNTYIINNYGVEVKQMSLTRARSSKALAFFADKYENKVRAISVGDFSLELCGGTHLNSTGQIGIFKIVQETSIASGIRRIEAVTAGAAYKLMKQEEAIIADMASELNVPVQNLKEELQKRLTRLKELEKQQNYQKLELIKNNLDILIQNAKMVNNIKIINHVFENIDIDLLRKTVDMIKEKTDNAVIALGSNYQGKALLVMGLTLDLVQKNLDASRLIKSCAKAIGGSGGGRKDFAQAGGNKPDNFETAFIDLEDAIANLK